MGQMGSYRTVVGSYRVVEQLKNARVVTNGRTIDTFLSKTTFCLFNKCVKFQLFIVKITRAAAH